MREMGGVIPTLGLAVFFCLQWAIADSNNLRTGACVCRENKTVSTPLCELVVKRSDGRFSTLASLKLKDIEAKWGSCERDTCLKEGEFQSILLQSCGGSYNVARESGKKFDSFVDRTVPGKCWCELTKDKSACYLFRKDEEGNIQTLEERKGLEAHLCSSQQCLRSPLWSSSLVQGCPTGLVPSPDEPPLAEELFDALSIPSGTCFCEEDRRTQSCVLYKKLGQLLVALDSKPSNLKELEGCRLEPCMNSQAFKPIVATSCRQQVEGDGRVRFARLAWTRRVFSEAPWLAASAPGNGDLLPPPPPPTLAQRRRREMLKYLATNAVTDAPKLEYHTHEFSVPPPPPLLAKRLPLKPDEKRVENVKLALLHFSKFNSNVFMRYHGSQVRTDLAVNQYNAEEPYFWFPYLKFTEGGWNRPKNAPVVGELLYTLSRYLNEYDAYLAGKTSELDKTYYSEFNIVQGPKGYEYLTAVGKDRVSSRYPTVVHFDPRLIPDARQKSTLSYNDFQVFEFHEPLGIWKIVDEEFEPLDPDHKTMGRYLKWNPNGYWMIGMKMPGIADIVFTPVSPGFAEPYERRGNFGRLATPFLGKEAHLKEWIEARMNLESAYQRSLLYLTGKINASTGKTKLEWVEAETLTRNYWDKSIAPPEAR